MRFKQAFGSTCCGVTDKRLATGGILKTKFDIR